MRPVFGSDSEAPTIVYVAVVPSSSSTVDHRTETDSRTSARRVDDDRGPESSLERLDPALEERLLLARCVIFGVLLEVAVLLGRPDAGDDRGPLDTVESSSSSARSRAAPSGVREPSVGGGAGGATGRALGRTCGLACRGRSGRAPSSGGGTCRCGSRGRVRPVGTGRDGGARAARRGRPRRHRRGPGRSVVGGGARRHRLGDERTCQAGRLPLAGRPLAGSRRAGRPSCREVPLAPAVGTDSANAASSASSYSSGASVAAHQTRTPSSGSERPQPVPDRNTAAGRRARSRPSPPPAGRPSARSSPDVEDGLRRKPERGESRRERFRERPLTVETQRLHALDPLPDTGQLDGRGRKRCGKLDDEDAWPWAGTGRPQTAGPSAISPTERSRPAASGVVVIARWYRWAARVIVREDDIR